MTLHLLHNTVSTLQTLHENTLRQWPIDAPFYIPVLSTPDEIRNYLRLLPDSTSIVVHSQMKYCLLQILALNFPTRLILFLPPHFEIHQAKLFLPYLPYRMRILLDGMYPVDLLNQLPSGCHLIFNKNVVDYFPNIPCFLPNHCMITIPDNISTFQLAVLRTYLKPHQIMIPPLTVHEEKPKLSVHCEFFKNSTTCLMNNSNSREISHSKEEKMVARILTEICQYRPNLSDLPGLMIKSNRIGLVNSLLISVAKAIFWDVHTLHQSINQYLKDYSYFFTYQFGIQNYHRILESFENHDVKDWRMFEVVARLFQSDILVLSEQTLYFFQCTSLLASQGLPLYLMYDFFDTFHAYQRNDELPEAVIMQNVLARYSTENIRRIQIH